MYFYVVGAQIVKFFVSYHFLLAGRPKIRHPFLQRHDSKKLFRNGLFRLLKTMCTLPFICYIGENGVWCPASMEAP
jgi:hypothetical protein